MDIPKSKTSDSTFRSVETQQFSNSAADYTEEDNKSQLQNTKKFTYTFSTQPLETDLKKLLTQVTGKIDLPSITEVKLKVVSGHAGLHRLSDFTPHLRILILDGSCIASFRDLGSSLKSLTTLSVARCNMRHLDGVSGFRNLEDLNVRENFISDPSACSSVKKLSKLDLSRNEITEVSYFAFLRSCLNLRELRVNENQFSDYKDEIRTLLPRLKILDGEELENLLQPDDIITLEEGEDLTSGDESSTSFSAENFDLEETQPIGDGVEPENFGENLSDCEKRSDYGFNSGWNNPKIMEKKNEGEEETPVTLHPHDSEGDESIATAAAAAAAAVVSREKSSGKLSSGRVICGNLAVSLRTRNPTKLSCPSLNVAQIKDEEIQRSREESQKKKENETVNENIVQTN